MTEQQLANLASEATHSLWLTVFEKGRDAGESLLLANLQHVRAATLREAAQTARNHCGCGCCETLARKLESGG